MSDNTTDDHRPTARHKQSDNAVQRSPWFDADTRRRLLEVLLDGAEDDLASTANHLDHAILAKRQLARLELRPVIVGDVHSAAWWYEQSTGSLWNPDIEAEAKKVGQEFEWIAESDLRQRLDRDRSVIPILETSLTLSEPNPGQRDKSWTGELSDLLPEGALALMMASSFSTVGPFRFLVLCVALPNGLLPLATFASWGVEEGCDELALEILEPYLV